MLIERKEYLDKLLAWMDKQLIKVITGVRRCGKSTLMEMFQAHLKREGVEESAIPIGNKIKIKFIKELHFQARKRAIFRKR